MSTCCGAGVSFLGPRIEGCFFGSLPDMCSGIDSRPPTGCGPNTVIGGDLIKDKDVVGKAVRGSIVFGGMFIKGGYIVGGSVVLGSMCLKSGACVRGYVMRDESAVHTGAERMKRSKVGVIVRGGRECTLWTGVDAGALGGNIRVPYGTGRGKRLWCTSCEYAYAWDYREEGIGDDDVCRG